MSSRFDKRIGQLEKEVRDLDDWAGGVEPDEFVTQPQRFPHRDGADLGDNYIGLQYSDKHGDYPGAVSDRLVLPSQARQRMPEVSAGAGVKAGACVQRVARRTQSEEEGMWQEVLTFVVLMLDASCGRSWRPSSATRSASRRPCTPVAISGNLGCDAAACCVRLCLLLSRFCVLVRVRA